MTTYTNLSLRAILDIPRERPIDCLEVVGPISITWKIVNIREDLTGFHLIIEKVG